MEALPRENQRGMEIVSRSAGRSLLIMGSQAGAWEPVLAIGEKCRIFRHLFFARPSGHLRQPD
ncbi:hypothetical protein Pla52n_16240 [Stieleria varia]|uniref:Uncharacterized protein n=1 Tax=Stieleria varia TaxID=2528005 RepID=A0A5C6B1X7_9BACT|nr:hypothetical protein Pla52n_16240 [Stieleria varia]